MTTWSCEPQTASEFVVSRQSRAAPWWRRVGATCLDDGRCEFTVWAPRAKRLEIKLIEPQERIVSLDGDERGYFQAVVPGVAPGSLYLFRLDGDKERPDPASAYQPFGVHKSSQVCHLRQFPWSDARWSGLDLEDYVIYELHVGTFSREGTLDAVIPRLDHLKELGITALEIMPVAQFPGERNWGYDGVFPFAVQSSYGGPHALQSVVDACHQRGMAVVLDVVYNHLGPEGNYLADFGPYFTDQYRTPWGQALNFDGPQSDEVVNFFVQNALQWVDTFHVDALRLDAIHGIVDRNAQPFLELLSGEIDVFARNTGRKIFLIAETDLNDARFVFSRDRHGYGMHAQWNDDFHHAVHALVTGENEGYYQDFGSVEQLGKAFSSGYVYTGEYSEYRKRRHGNSSRDIDAQQLVVFTQNHDQVGNRMLGDRLAQSISFEAQKLCAGLLILSPFLALIFMGQEYGETAPFQYFTSHSDPSLIEAVRRGRNQEFAAFAWKGEAPDPQDETTFLNSKLNPELADTGPHRTLWSFYQQLLALRRTIPALHHLSKENLRVQVFEQEKCLVVSRWAGNSRVLLAFNLSSQPRSLKISQAGNWEELLNSAGEQWAGPGRRIAARLSGEREVQLHLCATSFSLLRSL